MPDAPAAAPAAPSTSSAPSAPAAAPNSTVGPGTQAGSGGQSTAPSSPKSTPSASPRTDKPSLPHGGDNAADAPAVKADGGTDAQKPGETKAEAIQRMKLKAKVNGKEIEREYTEQELQLYLQKGLGAEEKFQEAANIRKTFQSFMEAVKENPFEAFKDPAFGDLGTNFKQLVIDNLAKEFQAEELKAKDPREYELNELRAEKAKREARDQAEAKSRQEAAQKEADSRYWAETKKSWDAELEKAGFGTSPHMIHQLAQIGQEFLDSEMDLSPNLLVAELKTRVAEQQKMLYGSLEGEQLVQALGQDIVNKLLTHSVAQARKGRVTQDPIKPPEAPAAEKEPEIPGTKATLRSYADFMRQK